MRLYLYIVTHDTGFAPNPFFGVCTLACCKPEIRRTAQKGDWIVGLTPKALGNRVVYCMRVDERLGFDEDWVRYKRKQPDPNEAICWLKTLLAGKQSEHAVNETCSTAHPISPPGHGPDSWFSVGR